MEIGPEEQKYNEWLKKEKENGLTSIHVSIPIKEINCNKEGETELVYSNKCSREEYFKSINQAVEYVASGNYQEYKEEDIEDKISPMKVQF